MSESNLNGKELLVSPATLDTFLMWLALGLPIEICSGGQSNWHNFVTEYWTIPRVRKHVLSPEFHETTYVRIKP